MHPCLADCGWAIPRTDRLAFVKIIHDWRAWIVFSYFCGVCVFVLMLFFYQREITANCRSANQAKLAIRSFTHARVRLDPNAALAKEFAKLERDFLQLGRC